MGKQVCRDSYTGRFVYHGTRYARAIQADNRIKVAPRGDVHVSLTRSFDVAVYWAALERDDDEGVGAVLILDRRALEAAHQLSAFVSGDGFEDEHEEACHQEIGDLDRYLVAAVPVI